MRTSFFVLLFVAAASTASAQYGDLKDPAERARFEADQKVIADNMPPYSYVHEFKGNKYTYVLIEFDHPVGTAEHSHVWTDTKGKTVRGELAGLEITITVKLEKPDPDGVWRGGFGRSVKVPLAKLCAKDQEEVKRRIASMTLPCKLKKEGTKKPD